MTLKFLCITRSASNVHGFLFLRSACFLCVTLIYTRNVLHSRGMERAPLKALGRSALHTSISDCQVPVAVLTRVSQATSMQNCFVSLFLTSIARLQAENDYVDNWLSFSSFPLSGSVAAGKLTCAFEELWGVL
jgi:hypothetical protein